MTTGAEHGHAQQDTMPARLDTLALRLLDLAGPATPAQVPVMLQEQSTAAGLGGAVIYLQDFDHQTLIPLHPPGASSLEAERINDDRPAGLAFRSDRIVHTGSPNGSRRVWVPLRDGGERVGLLALTLDGAAAPSTDTPPGPAASDEADAPAAVEPALWRVARVVAALLVVKGAYSDAFFFARRRQAMALAAEMQWQLLPPLTLHAPGVSIAGMLSPAYEVGGDSFDYALNADTLHFAIFDAMGHGLRAAILATAVVGAYRHARRGRVGLRDKYALVDDVVRSQFGEEHFCTAQMIDLDVPSGVLRWVNAGHPRPLLLRNGRVIRSLRSAPTLPMGFGGETPQVSEEQLEPGDRLLFFTDGVIEERTPTGVELGVDGLKAFLEHVETARQPVAETVRLLTGQLLDRRAAQPADDSTVVLLEWRPLGAASG